MEIKHQIVMLPTEKQKGSGIYYANNKYKLQFMHLFPSKAFQELGYKLQHLYILSDEEIKEGDLIMRAFDKIIIRDNINSDNRKGEKFHKIIATTNPELHREFTEPKINGNLTFKGMLIPSIPQSFISIYIKAYNEGNPIKEVMVEYEWKVIEDGENGYAQKDTNRLKLNPDNTIIIKEIEEKRYSREEVVNVLTKFDNYLTSSMIRDGYYNGIDFVEEFMREEGFE